MFENVGWSENCYENDLILNLFEKHTMCNKKTPQETHLQAKSFYQSHAVGSFFKTESESMILFFELKMMMKSGLDFFILKSY